MNLQLNVIGFFKSHFRLESYEMIVSNDNGHLKTITIGHLFGLQTNHIEASNGKVVMFENGETLYSLLSSPDKVKQYVNKIQS